jgi:hypothetical protein
VPYGQAISQVVGAGMQLGGAIMGANQANKRRNQLLGIAETPGIDTKKTAADALNNLASNLPAAEQLAGDVNQFNQDQIDLILEQIVPGYKASQAKRSKNSAALLAGELPPDVEARVNRRAAERGVSGGFSGSRFATNLGLRDLGLTTLDAMTLGDRLFQGQVSGTPRTEMVNPLAYAGLNPQQEIALRSGERYDKLDRLTAWAGAPTGRDIYSKYLTDTGGQIQGMSASGSFGKGGLGFGGG